MFYLAGEWEKFGDVLTEKKVTLSWLINSNMVKPKKCDHLHLVHHFTAPLNHPIYASTVISTESCNIKIKAPKTNDPKKSAWQEHIQKLINTLRSDLEKLNIVQDFQIKKTED